MTVISTRRAYRAYIVDETSTRFNAWKAAQTLTRLTAPLVRGTTAYHGGPQTVSTYYLFGA